MQEILNLYILPALLIAGKILLLLVPLIVCVAMLTYMERKVIARMQLRKGPNVVGVFGLGQAFADGKKLPFDTLEQLRAQLPLPPGEGRGEGQRGNVSAVVSLTQPSPGGRGRSDAPFIYPVANFYMTDPISRASPTMAECVSVILEGKDGREAA